MSNLTFKVEVSLKNKLVAFLELDDHFFHFYKQRVHKTLSTRIICMWIQLRVNETVPQNTHTEHYDMIIMHLFYQ